MSDIRAVTSPAFDAPTIEIPALVEPHAHLDKAFLAERAPNPAGDLLGAVAAIDAIRSTMTVADTIERAHRAVRLLVDNGVTAIRTHADTTVTNGMVSVEALLQVRNAWRSTIVIQVCALSGWPVLGVAGTQQRALLDDAIAAGVDLVGGCPALEDDPAGANDYFISLAAEAGLPLDMHIDETLDPGARSLEDLADKVRRLRPAHTVTAGHCVSLSVRELTEQHRVADLVADAGIGVIALPLTNLYLQGRDHPRSMPRGVAPVRVLRAAGVTVAAGGDNLQDPFNPLGRGDPLETAGLLMATSHVPAHEALAMVSTDARAVMGLEPSGDRVRLRAASAREAIAFGPPGRELVRATMNEK